MTVLRNSVLRHSALANSALRKSQFDPIAFLSTSGLGRHLVRLKAKQVFFAQGHPADSVFYLQTGRAKLTIVSKGGKEATITLLAAGDFIGEESIIALPRPATRHRHRHHHLHRAQDRPRCHAPRHP
jgi:CRP-like cAMP-binding protein